ncbi:MAG: leucine efflux protein LeuE [Paludibacterium sp.]|uniref:leucine efflux protein LeuE n=1 Tax=Paludibacterium sp. TaxID=1917523 RepID=UPI0025E2AEFE|nr:leucine efflux protein LeuE [Paludibacterium sp.]MBV8048582.1 leucine efflux protein LeuE [Paludibacterium sp.]MBV8649289.1 leucine efflux protein LeuE [Paludibacterium sp.]
MLGITDLTTYVIGVVIIVLLPGPNSLYVLSVAAQRGIMQGFRGACGVFAGDTVLMTLAATGAAGLLRANPTLFAVIKYSGGAYLAWLGIAMLRGGWRGWRLRGQDVPAASVPAIALSRPFSRAFAISLMNPKAILFFVSFFVQFVNPSYVHPALTFLALGAILQFFSALYLSTLIFTGTRLAQAFRRRQGLSAVLKGGVGTLFLGFGAKLALASLN